MESEHIEGSGPEWYISCMWYSRDTPFWSRALDMFTPRWKVPSIGRLQAWLNQQRCITQDSQPNTLPTELFQQSITLQTGCQSRHANSYIFSPKVVHAAQACQMGKPNTHTQKKRENYSLVPWNLQGKRKAGRPRNSWRRYTEAELKQQGTNWSGMARTAQNRVRWRGVVDGLSSIVSDGHKEGFRPEWCISTIYHA